MSFNFIVNHMTNGILFFKFFFFKGLHTQQEKHKKIVYRNEIEFIEKVIIEQKCVYGLTIQCCATMVVVNSDWTGIYIFVSWIAFYIVVDMYFC